MPKNNLPFLNNASPETEELAWELQQNRPDSLRIKWLIEDRGADISMALAMADLEKEDLLKKPSLRPLHLEKHIQNRS